MCFLFFITVVSCSNKGIPNTEGTTYKRTVRACYSSANWSAQSAVLNVISKSDIYRTVSHGSQLLLSDVGTSGTLSASGFITTSSDGQIIENLLITGNITINHNNVIVRNCKIMHGNGLDGVVVSAGTLNALISHCEMDALSQVPGNYGSMGVVVEGNATVIRCYMHNVRSGMSILNAKGFGSFIENYVRDLVDANGAHNTSASCHGTPGPVEILRNNFVEGNSSAFSLYSDFGSNTNVLIQDNFLIGTGSGYGMYGGYSHLEKGYAQHNSNIRVIGNRWKKPFGWGPVAAMKMDQPGAVWEDNAYEDGTPIPPKEGI